MTGLEMYSTGKQIFGMGSDIFGAYRDGQKVDEDARVYARNNIEGAIRDKESFRWQEHAKDRAQFGAAAYTESYLWSGKQKLKSIEGQLADNNEALLMQASLAYEQSAAVDETVGNMMSRNAIDAMKSEARLVASAAGTGTEGGTTDVAIRDARSNEQFDNAVLMGRAANDKLNINRRLSMERLSAKNKKKYIASELGTVFGANGAGAAYEKGYAQSYAALPKSVKEGYISFDKINPSYKRTAFDDILGYADIIGASDLDSEMMALFTDKPIEVKKA